MALSGEERQQLADKLAQAQRLADEATDPTAIARLTQLVLELEEKLRSDD